MKKTANPNMKKLEEMEKVARPLMIWLAQNQDVIGWQAIVNVDSCEIVSPLMRTICRDIPLRFVDPARDTCGKCLNFVPSSPFGGCLKYENPHGCGEWACASFISRFKSGTPPPLTGQKGEETMNEGMNQCTPMPYIATKVVEAVPMRLGMFHGMHPAQIFPGNPEDEGYLVVYPQVGEKTPYHGWCPKAQFEAMNQDPSKGMTFGHALVMLGAGKKVARAGWNGKGMYLWILPGTNVPAEWCKEPHLKGLAEANGGHVECLPSVRMHTADHKVLTGWLASQTDMLATDWVVVG